MTFETILTNFGVEKSPFSFSALLHQALKKSSPECPHSSLLKTLFSYLELEEHIYCIEFNWACVQLCTVGKIRFFKHEKGKPSFMSFRTVGSCFMRYHISKQVSHSCYVCTSLICTPYQGVSYFVFWYICSMYCFTLKIHTWICDY